MTNILQSSKKTRQSTLFFGGTHQKLNSNGALTLMLGLLVATSERNSPITNRCETANESFHSEKVWRVALPTPLSCMLADQNVWVWPIVTQRVCYHDSRCTRRCQVPHFEVVLMGWPQLRPD